MKIAKADLYVLSTSSLPKVRPTPQFQQIHAAHFQRMPSIAEIVAKKKLQKARQEIPRVHVEAAKVAPL